MFSFFEICGEVIEKGGDAKRQTHKLLKNI
jgi:hypothetical protein